MLEISEKEEKVKFKDWVMVCAMLAVVCVATCGFTEELGAGEKAAVKMLGMEADYKKMFSPQDYMAVIVSMPSDGKGQSEFTRQFDSSHTVQIGYLWSPEKINPPQAKLNKEQFLKECGKPDSQSETQLAYGRITLSFDKEGSLSEVAILFNK